MKFINALKTTCIAAVITAASIGQAQASIYASSFLEIRNLSIGVIGVNQPAVASWSFTLLNVAVLNGADDTTFGFCNQTAGCTSGVAPALDPGAAQVGTSQPNNTFTYLGPGSGEYARADSVIDDAQLAGDQTTRVRNIAEAELQTGTNAVGLSDIQSITGFNYTFTASGPGTLILQFEANVDLLAAIDDANADTADAQAQVTTQFLFSQDGTANSLQWNPTTTTTNDVTCTDADIDGAGITCNQQTVAQNLNANVGTTTTPFSSDAYSRGDDFFGVYFLSISFANAGTYTLTLSETKNVTVTRTVAVPEPSILLLLGAGLAGLGIMRRRIR